MGECIIIAHRGASGLAPENTLLAYRIAIELGADMIELDVHETNDGYLVCIHDYEVDRTTDGTGAIAELSLKELQKLDAGQHEHIPLLSEVLEHAHGKIRVNIELKVTDVEKQVVQLVREKRMTDHVVVSSFLHGTLEAMHEVDPTITTAVLVSKPMEDLVEYVSDLKAKALNPLHTMVTSELINQMHNHNIQVFPWTINDSSTMLHLVRMRIDGLITDYPDIAIETLRSMRY